MDDDFHTVVGVTTALGVKATLRVEATLRMKATLGVKTIILRKKHYQSSCQNKNENDRAKM